MLVGPTKVLFMDEISTGLDSSTTFQIAKSLQQFVHILEGTAFISLLQPAPETYELFDDIILLSDGKIVYQGPGYTFKSSLNGWASNVQTEKVLLIFYRKYVYRSLFHYFHHQVIALKYVHVNFIILIIGASKRDQQQYWVKDTPYQYISAIEFAEAFQSFHIGSGLQGYLSTPFNKQRNHPLALTSVKYGVNQMELFQACLSKEYLLMKRNSFVYIFKLMQVRCSLV